MPGSTRIDAVQDTITAKIQKLTDTVDRLYRRGAERPLKRILHKLHPADLAAVLAALPDGHIASVFTSINDNQMAGEVLVELSQRVRNILFEEIPLDQLTPVFEQLPPDELADLVQELPPEYSEKLVQLLRRDSKEELEDLLQYSPDTAGGIMTPDFFALADTVAVHDAIEAVRQHYDVEMVFYLYVTDSDGKLAGVISLRQLLLAQPDKLLHEIMNTRVVSVQTDTPQDQVANLVDNYQLLAIPVLDEQNMLVGMVTIDDVIEVIEAQTTKHILQMAGTNESEIVTQSALKIAFIRLPWLLASFAGSLIATSVIQRSEPLISQLLALSAFLPVVMGMAGNVGVQTSTVAVRSLATGSLDLHNAVVVLFKELRIGILLGTIYGTLLGIFGWIFYGNLQLAQIISLTLLINMTGAVLLAILLPLAFYRMGTDPAYATGPFVTTITDILGVLNYFFIANTILNIV